MSTTEIAAPCQVCGRVYDLTVDADRFKRWRGGEGLIQNMLPELSAAERELLITKTCDDCWRKMFGKRRRGTSAG